MEGRRAEQIWIWSDHLRLCILRLEHQLIIPKRFCPISVFCTATSGCHLQFPTRFRAGIEIQTQPPTTGCGWPASRSPFRSRHCSRRRQQGISVFLRNGISSNRARNSASLFERDIFAAVSLAGTGVDRCGHKDSQK